MLIEVIVNNLGIPIAESLLKIWLKETPVAQSIGIGLVNILKKKSDDYLTNKKVARQFENIADKIGESLLPVFESYDFEENSYKCVATEVAETIKRANITVKLLAELSYSHAKLYDKLLLLGKNRSKLLSSAEKELFKRSLDLSSQYIIDLASQLPNYNTENFKEILKRFDKLSEDLYKVLDDLEALTDRSYEKNHDRKSVDFERDYRAAIARKYDRLNLFGVDLSRKTKRYQLSIAYVALDVDINEDNFYSEGNDSKISVEEALQEVGHAVIIGEAGTGKTTLLQWLAVNSATKNLQEYIPYLGDTIPFIVELRRYTGKTLTIDFFIKQIVPDIYSRIPDKWIHNMLESGNVLLLIDGLDEISTKRRNEVLDWIEELNYEYNLHIIVTSRPGAKEWKCLMNEMLFKHLSLASMSIERTNMFVKHWHKAILQDRYDADIIEMLSNKLFNKIQNNISILKLSSNPLLCAMLCALHFERNMQLPSDRSELYEACCAMLLERRDAEREIELDINIEMSYKQKRVILNDLAYWMLRNGETSVTIEEAINHIKLKLQNMNEKLNDLDSKKVLNMFIERSGIIREPNHGIIDFVHRTFQEYMAANAASIEGDWGVLKSHACDDLWHETIILAAGFANNKQADKLIEDLLKLGENKNDDLYQYDLLAMSCLETAVEVSECVRAKVIAKIDNLIPPKNDIQCKALAATGDLAVPFLGHKKGYDVKDTLFCIKTLDMISSRTSLAQLSSHINNNQSIDVLKAIKNILYVTRPDEVYASNLYYSILNYIEKIKTYGMLKINGIILGSLIEVPYEKLKKFFSDINEIKVSSCQNTSISIISQMDNLHSVLIDGKFDDIEKLSKLKNLKNLDIRSNDETLKISDLKKHSKIESIRLMSKSPKWFNMYELCELPKLRSLSIYSNNGPEIDYYLFHDLSNLYKLKHLHICSTKKFDLDLSPLNTFKSLECIEITTFSTCMPQNIITLLEIINLKKVVIRTDIDSNEVRSFISSIEMALPSCDIQAIYGWNPNKW